jgi:hypothetical protein
MGLDPQISLFMHLTAHIAFLQVVFTLAHGVQEKKQQSKFQKETLMAT